VSERLQQIIDEATDAWGVKVSRTEIKDLEIPGGLRTAMAKEAAAERERRAMVIRAQGEKEAAKQLASAAAELDRSPGGLQLRYLQTLLQVAEGGNTVVFAPTPELAHAALTAAEVQARTNRDASRLRQWLRRRGLAGALAQQAAVGLAALVALVHVTSHRRLPREVGDAFGASDHVFVGEVCPAAKQ
jgi:regulator of protease activity HflC (stomatin/prohibitin superfamily)